LRISEALGVRWSDITGNVLSIIRQVYDGKERQLKSKSSARQLWIEDWLLDRMRGLGQGEFVFRSRKGTPLNRSNLMNRYIRPAAIKLGLTVGGLHDFRHTLSTTMRREGVHPKVISGILGHRKVSLAMDVYDRVDLADIKQPLRDLAQTLQPNAAKTEAAA
jgi:integrase